MRINTNNQLINSLFICEPEGKCTLEMQMLILMTTVCDLESLPVQFKINRLQETAKEYVYYGDWFKSS